MTLQTQIPKQLYKSNIKVIYTQRNNNAIKNVCRKASRKAHIQFCYRQDRKFDRNNEVFLSNSRRGAVAFQVSGNLLRTHHYSQIRKILMVFVAAYLLLSNISMTGKFLTTQLNLSHGLHVTHTSP